MTHRLSDPGRLGTGSTLEFPFRYRPAVATDVRETWRLARERSSIQGKALGVVGIGLALAIAGCSLVSTPEGYHVGGASAGGFAAESAERTNRNGPTGNSATVPDHR
jgi:hypothetical protein